LAEVEVELGFLLGACYLKEEVVVELDEILKVKEVVLKNLEHLL
jgi:hypothetical protein